MAASTRRRKRQPPDDKIAVKGSFRLHILEDGEVVHDTGWVDNQVTRVGWQQYLAGRLMAVTGSNLQVGYCAIGTGGTVDASTTSLPGEIGGGTIRQAIGANTQISTATNGASAVMSFTFPSGSSAMTGNISNVGLYSGSSGTALFAGNTYASQALSSNQAVNVTYTVGFA